MTVTAIKMADPLTSSLNTLPVVDAAAILGNGMALNLTVRADGTLLLTKSQMSTHERLIMEVPLDINAMSEADFDSLPGIGPVIARRIVAYRQNNGGTMTVMNLNEIEGIGEKKYKQLLKYF